MATYKYSGENMFSGNPNIRADLQGNKFITDDLMNSVGLYSKEDIEDLRFHKYSRFGRVLDPYGKLNDTREFLFFVKPDLHICVNDSLDNDDDDRKNNTPSVYTIGGYDQLSTSDLFKANGLYMNPQLDNNQYFMDLIDKHPQIVYELQDGLSSGGSADHFSHLLSSAVSSNLSLPGSEATTMTTGSTMFGTHLEYLKDSEAPDENPEFSLEFVDNKYLDVYHFFKAYSEYHKARKSGLVTPPSMSYYQYKRLHNVMGIYKFLVAEDMETIIYWAYFWGVFPITAPRDAFSDSGFQEGLTFSINFKAAFMDDMNPTILQQFNNLMAPLVKDVNNWIPVVKQSYSPDIIQGVTHSYDPNLDNVTAPAYFTSQNKDANTMRTIYYPNGGSSRIDGRLARAALVDGRQVNNETRRKYRLRWYE